MNVPTTRAPRHTLRRLGTRALGAATLGLTALLWGPQPWASAAPTDAPTPDPGNPVNKYLKGPDLSALPGADAKGAEVVSVVWAAAIIAGLVMFFYGLAGGGLHSIRNGHQGAAHARAWAVGGILTVVVAGASWFLLPAAYRFGASF